jgi:hypothetical protein
MKAESDRLFGAFPMNAGFYWYGEMVFFCPGGEGSEERWMGVVVGVTINRSKRTYQVVLKSGVELTVPEDFITSFNGDIVIAEETCSYFTNVAFPDKPQDEVVKS